MSDPIDDVMLMRSMQREAAELRRACFAAGAAMKADATSRLNRQAELALKTADTLAKISATDWSVMTTRDDRVHTRVQNSLLSCNSKGKQWQSSESFSFVAPEVVSELRAQIRRYQGDQVSLRKLDSRRLALVVSDRQGRPLNRLARTFPLSQKPTPGCHIARFAGQNFENFTAPISSVVSDG